MKAPLLAALAVLAFSFPPPLPASAQAASPETTTGAGAERTTTPEINFDFVSFRTAGQHGAGRMTFSVPVRYKSELDGYRQNISSYQATLSSMAFTIGQMHRQAESDAAQFKQALWNRVAAHEATQAGIDGRIREVRALACERARQFKTEAGGLAPTYYDAPPQYAAKARAYNLSVAQMNDDRQALILAMNQLVNEAGTARGHAEAALRQLQRAFAENQQAHQQAINAKAAEYQATVNAVNQWVDIYNTKLRDYGTPVSARP